MGNVEVAYGRIAPAVAIILDKSPGQYCNIHIFLSFLGCLLKQYILYEIFLQFPPPLPILYKVETRKEFWIHTSKIVCGVRGVVGPV